jgi:N-acetylglucosamine-6-phosphate deacetylase
LTRIVTLAPEQDPGGRVTRMLTDQAIVVSAGHTNTDLETLYAAIDQGLQMFTHLGNGCPMMLHRHDNIIQRVLSMSDLLYITFIADGAHIPYPALDNYLELVGVERAIVVTDAIAAAGLGPGQYSLGNQTVDVGSDGVCWAPDRSHFVGSALTMPQAEINLAEQVGLDEDSIHALLYANPRNALHLPLI